MSGSRSGSVRRTAAILGVVWSAVFVPRAVFAHGPAPAVLQVLAVDEAGPLWLRTSIGLVRRRVDGAYSFTCPSRWDGNENVRASALWAAGGESVLLFSRGVAYLTTDGGCAFDALDLGSPVVDVAALGSRFVVDAGGLYEVSAVGEVELSDEDFDADDLAARGGELVVARQVEGVAEVSRGDMVWRFGEDVEIVRIRRVAADPGVAATVEGVLQRGGAQELFSLDPDGSVRSGPSGAVVLGPLRVDGFGYAMVDGTLHVEQTGVWGARGPAPWTCLQDDDVGKFACSLDGLAEVLGGDADGLDVVTRFRFVQLGAPDCAPSQACDLDWAHFGGESGWIETEPARGPEGMRTPRGSGCSASGVGRGSNWGDSLVGVILLALVLARRR